MDNAPALLNEAMRLLAADSRTLFLGQGVGVGGDGVATYDSFDGIPMDRRIEFPEAEDLNLGAATGLSLVGYLPVVVLPRLDFLMRAMDQLVNHLDKMEAMSCGDFKPKVIIRTRVGSRTPLDAGPQHTQDHTAVLTMMLKNVVVQRIGNSADILEVYGWALTAVRSVLVIETV